jgi:hypothetical protein
MLGSDYPFAIMESHPLACLADLPESTRMAIAHDNALRWLRGAAAQDCGNQPTGGTP